MNKEWCQCQGITRQGFHCTNLAPSDLGYCHIHLWQEHIRDAGNLISELEAPRWRTRQRAAIALGILGDTQAVEPLVLALKDRSEHVRQSTADALGKLGDRRAVESLLLALQEENCRTVRVCLIGALGRLGDERAIETLVDIYRGGDLSEQNIAYSALSDIGHSLKPAEVGLVALSTIGYDTTKPFDYYRDMQEGGPCPYCGETLKNLGWSWACPNKKCDFWTAWFKLD
jgi:hypothetical protein